MRTKLTNEAMIASAAKFGICLLRNEEGDLIAPMHVIADALDTSEADLFERLQAKGARFVMVTDMKLTEVSDSGTH